VGNAGYEHSQKCPPQRDANVRIGPLASQAGAVWGGMHVSIKWLVLGICVLVLGLAQIWEGVRIGAGPSISPAFWGTLLLGVGLSLIVKANEPPASS